MSRANASSLGREHSRNEEMTEARHFPIYLDLRGKRCLVVGGGATALSKIEALLETGAQVAVVAPRVGRKIRALHRAARIDWLPRRFEPRDAEGAFLVVSTLANREENQAIFDVVDARNRLVNVHDDAPRCNFIYPAVARSGPVQVAVSTAGKSPAVAQRIRNRIDEEILGQGVGDLVAFIGSRRAEVRRTISSFESRVRFWRELLDSDFPEILAGDETEGDARFNRLLNRYRDLGTSEKSTDGGPVEVSGSPPLLCQVEK